MSDRPEYVGLLNRLSNGESNAHCYLSAWADTTEIDELRSVLRMVAAREGEHGMSMAKRINELGYELEPFDDPKMDDRMAVARSETMSDAEKFEAMGLVKYFPTDGEPDYFDGMFRDHSIDPQTGALLGRYIAEERDSTRHFIECYTLLKQGEAGGSAALAGDRLAALDGKVDALCEAVDELRRIVSDQPAPAAAPANGRQKARATAR